MTELTHYDETDIEFLEGLEALLKRPGMYIGELGNHAIFQLVKEAVDNILDEVLAGRNDYCLLYAKGNEYIVHDKSQGIPVDIHKKAKISTLTLIFTRLHAGGKFNSKSYKAVSGCFTGETEVQLVDGRTLTFEELYLEHKEGVVNYVWSVDRNTGELHAQPVQEVQLSKYTKDLVDVELDSGDIINCTPDHPFYKPTLEKVKAKDSLGNSVLYVDIHKDKDGYLVTNYDTKKYRLNRIVADYYGLSIKNRHIHHIDHNKVNNEPDNLEALTPKEHYDSHPEKLEKWVKYLEVSSKEKGKVLTSLNLTEEWQILARKGKVLRITCRLYRDRLPINEDSYNSMRYHGSPKWSTALSLFKSVKNICKETKKVYEAALYLHNKDLHKGTLFLNSLNYEVGISENSIVHNHDIYTVAKRVIGKVVKQLNNLEIDISNYSVLELNEILGKTSGCRSLCQYIDIDDFIDAYSKGIVDYKYLIYDDLSNKERLRRIYHYEKSLYTNKSKTWGNRQIAVFSNEFLRKVNSLLEEGLLVNYLNYHNKFKNKAGGCSWASGFRACILRGLDTKKKIIKAAKEINHKVVSVTSVKLEKEVPVYGLKIPVDHNYRLANGVIVGNTHGVGIKCLTAYSNTLEVWTKRNNKWYHQTFSNGKETSKVINKVPSKEVVTKLGYKPTKGTVIRWIPNLQFLGEDAKLEGNKLFTYIENLSLLNKGFKIVVKSGSKQKEFCNTEGNLAFINHVARKKKLTLINNPLNITTNSFDIGIQFSDYDHDDGISSFVNCSRTTQGGKHVEFFFNALNKVLKKYKNNRHDYTPSDVKYGLIGFINCRITDPSFDSQTKECLIGTNAKGHNLNYLEPEMFSQLDKFFVKNKSLAKAILERATLIFKARNRSKELLKAASVLKEKRNSLFLPEVLCRATRQNPNKNELFIVEGLSAGGTAKYARFKEYQEVLKMKGKPINSAKNPLSKTLNNVPIQNMLKALGYTIDKNKLTLVRRVARLYLLSDADSDGFHINLLELTALWDLAKEFYEEGRIFVIDAPLYIAKDKLNGDLIGKGNTLDEVREDIPKAKQNRSVITRLKGWGEINAEDLRVLAFDPKTRKAINIQSLCSNSEVEFRKVVGSDTNYRKELLGLI